MFLANEGFSDSMGEFDSSGNLYKKKKKRLDNMII